RSVLPGAQALAAGDREDAPDGRPRRAAVPGEVGPQLRDRGVPPAQAEGPEQVPALISARNRRGQRSGRGALGRRGTTPLRPSVTASAASALGLPGTRAAAAGTLVASAGSVRWPTSTRSWRTTTGRPRSCSSRS